MSVRYRCLSCGNLTRFDVVSTRRTRAFWHFTLGGEHAIDEEEILDETVESVTCRWCGKSSAIEVFEEPGAEVAGGAATPAREASAPF
ncbi:MAG: hypothetical protein ACLP81_07255 [Acidimicrobiales bacterium]